MGSAGVWRAPGAVLLALLVLTISTGSASARAYLPPGRHIFAGLTGGGTLTGYERMVGKHAPVFEVYMEWNTPTRWLANPRPGFRSRLGLELSTAGGYGQGGVISPGAIAAGRSDRFLLALGRNLARSKRIVYLRIMGEMDGHWNAYAAYNADGTTRGPQYTPHAFVQAWRRTVLILRGGRLARIDRRLRRLGLPAVQTRLRRTARLPRPRLAVLWVPQDEGSPTLPGNEPIDYWPGDAYVDWVGTDFYSSYPNFTLLDRFYKAFRGKPFVISEWGVDGTGGAAFVRDLFKWVRSHRRVRMLNYFQGFVPNGPYSLVRYPAARRALRAELRSRVFLAYPPEYAHPAPRRAGHHHRRRREPTGPPKPPVLGLPPSPPPPGSGGKTCVKPLGVCLP